MTFCEFDGRDVRELVRDVFCYSEDADLRAELLVIHDLIPIFEWTRWARRSDGSLGATLQLMRVSAPGLLLRVPDRYRSRTCFCGEGGDEHNHRACDLEAVRDHEGAFLKCVTCSWEHHSDGLSECKRAGEPLVWRLCPDCGDLARNKLSPVISFERGKGKPLSPSETALCEPAIPGLMLRMVTLDGEPFSVCISCGNEESGDPGVWSLCEACPYGLEALGESEDEED